MPCTDSKERMSNVEETKAAKQEALKELAAASGLPVSALESSDTFHDAAYRAITLLREQLAAAIVAQIDDAADYKTAEQGCS